MGTDILIYIIFTVIATIGCLCHCDFKKLCCNINRTVTIPNTDHRSDMILPVYIVVETQPPDYNSVMNNVQPPPYNTS